MLPSGSAFGQTRLVPPWDAESSSLGPPRRAKDFSLFPEVTHRFTQTRSDLHKLMQWGNLTQKMMPHWTLPYPSHQIPGTRFGGREHSETRKKRVKFTPSWYWT